MYQTDAAAIGMADQYEGPVGDHPFQEDWEFFQGIRMQIMDRAARNQRRRFAVTQPVVNQPGAVTCLAQKIRKIFPHGVTPQAFVQEHQIGVGFIAGDQAVKNVAGIEYR